MNSPINITINQGDCCQCEYHNSGVISVTPSNNILNSSFFIFTGGNNILNLPPLNQQEGKFIFVKNISNENLTLTGCNYGERFYSTGPYDSFVVCSGAAYIVAASQDYWNIM